MSYLPLPSVAASTDPRVLKRSWILAGIAALCLFRFAWTFKSTHNQLQSAHGFDSAELSQSLDGIPDRPIVGILSLPLSYNFRQDHHLNYTGDIPAVIPSSYVKWLQSAGAQVVVIPHFWESERISDLVSKLSAVLFTGGDYGDTAWNSTTAMIYNEVLRRNNTADPLALWATCLGYERVLQVASRDERNTVVTATLIDASIPVHWTTPTKSSSFLDYMGESTLSKFAHHPIAYNYHTYGVTPASWSAHSDLLDPLFNVIGMHHNDDGLEFIAMIEGKNGLPIWGVQFHPEKALFEWSPYLHYPHSETAVIANRKIADFFVSKVRQFSKYGSAKFNDFSDESKFAIYNYQSVFTGIDINATHAIYTETYIIDK